VIRPDDMRAALRAIGSREESTILADHEAGHAGGVCGLLSDPPRRVLCVLLDGATPDTWKVWAERRGSRSPSEAIRSPEQLRIAMETARNWRP
jgi:hypothetical protein